MLDSLAAHNTVRDLSGVVVEADATHWSRSLSGHVTSFDAA
jgi:hypothetical protein